MSQSYREPVYEGFPMPQRVVYRSIHEAWASWARQSQKEMRYHAEVTKGIEQARMAGIWQRLVRKWGSKHGHATA